MLAKGIPIKVGIYSFDLVNRALISAVNTGYVKLIVANDGTDRLIGMRAIGQQASAVIGPAQLVIANVCLAAFSLSLPRNSLHLSSSPACVA